MSKRDEKREEVDGLHDAGVGWRPPRERGGGTYRKSMSYEQRLKRNREVVARLRAILEHIAEAGEWCGEIRIEAKGGTAGKVEYTSGTGPGLDWRVPSIVPPEDAA